MRFGSLFAGIGGLDLGLERAGMRCAWQVEVNPFCSEVLARHWPHVPRYGDIRGVKGTELEHVDLIAGGFPCQDISNAGVRTGIDGERSGLWAEFARIIGELRPRLVLVENVSALAARGLGRVLGDLATLGFDAEWDCVRASDVGAPHRRERLFIVAYSNGGAVRAQPRREHGAHGADPSQPAHARSELAHAHEQQSGSVGWHERGDGAAEDRGGGPQEPGRRSCAVADADGGRWGEQRQPLPPGQRRAPWDVADGRGSASAAVGNSERERSQGRGGGLEDTAAQWRAPARLGHAASPTGGWPPGPADRAGWHAYLQRAPGTEPAVRRGPHGLPNRVDRLRALGNAVVPQVAEAIGRMIVQRFGGTHG